MHCKATLVANTTDELMEVVINIRDLANTTDFSKQLSAHV